LSISNIFKKYRELKKDKAKKNKKLSAAILILKLINIFKLSGAIG
jgi:hypothetical protein